MTRLPIKDLNALDGESFVAAIGSIYEHSPWIAFDTWKGRPFGSRKELESKLSATVRLADTERQVALIRAHPDLAGRLAALGKLTAESTHEQASVGLNQLTDDEKTKFEELNTQYREKFGFPFVICARLAGDRSTILVAFERRLKFTPEEEMKTALGEIDKIAALRLAEIVED